MPGDWSAWVVIGICLAAGYGVTSRLIDAWRQRQSPHVTQLAAGDDERRQQPRLTLDEGAGDEDCFVVLGLPTDADEPSVRDAYRRLVGQYHPDKVASLGPELVAVAERQTRRINAAYEEALKRIRARQTR